jgi:phosphoribosylglycinamide formyltransferase-1
MPRTRVGVLISGRGSNMQALVEAAEAADYPAEIVVVVSNRPEAAGLAYAASRGIAAVAVDHKAFPSKAAFEAAVDETLDGLGVELVCLAGFMRLLTPGFVERRRDRILNIHPSLLPDFRGLDTHERALAAGVALHGASVHFVRADVDSGPVVAQAPVPVMPDDTPESLSLRVLEAEHRLYPAALRLVAAGDVTVADDRLVRTRPVELPAGLRYPDER